MFVSFLLPYVDRGFGPLFSWVMLAQAASFRPDELMFIGDDQYFGRPYPWGTRVQPFGMCLNLPTETEWQRFGRVAVPRAVFDELDRRSVSMLDAFRTLLTEEYPPLCDALADLLAGIRRTTEISAVLSWCNVPSLSRAATDIGIPVIHNELGPLRPPRYVGTVYFDFCGVNGRTDASAQLMACTQDLDADQRRGLLTMSELRGVFAAETADPDEACDHPAFKVGVALQVEDDSNMLAFSHGLTNLDAIFSARRTLPASEVLIRHHPFGHARYARHLGTWDDSADAVGFIRRCERVVTVNSSVAFECLLHEKPVQVLGDSPAAVFSTERFARVPAHDRLAWLNYLLLGYLVPAAFLFDSDYYRWRLAHPSTQDLMRRHLAALRAQRDAVPRVHDRSFAAIGERLVADEVRVVARARLHLQVGTDDDERLVGVQTVFAGRRARMGFSFLAPEAGGPCRLRLEPLDAPGVVKIGRMAVSDVERDGRVWAATATGGFEEVTVEGTAIRSATPRRLEVASLGRQPSVLTPWLALQPGARTYRFELTLDVDLSDESVARLCRAEIDICRRVAERSEEARGRHLALELRLVLASEPARGRAVYVWGTGAAGRLVAKALARAGRRFAGFIEPDAGRTRGRIGGRPVLTPVAVSTLNDRPFVLVASQFHRQISRRLNRLGFKRGADYFVPSLP